MKSKAPVVVIVAIIVLGALLWGVWAIRMAGGVDPERAKTLAEEAERECVLEGYGPDECPKLVGRYHRACLEEAQKKSEGAMLKESAYLECMEAAFADATGANSADIGAPEAGSTPPEGKDGPDASNAGDAQ